MIARLILWIIGLCYVQSISYTYDDQDKIILCLGDSITNGTGSSNKAINSYPALLQLYLNEYAKERFKLPGVTVLGRIHRYPTLLKVHYQVVNLGVPGASMSINNSERAYWNTMDFQRAQTYKPSNVIIAFGTNDAKTYLWNESHYLELYHAFISNITAMTSHPMIHLVIPPPSYNDLKYHIQQDIVNNRLPVLIQGLAKTYNLPVINAFEALGGKNLSKRYLFYTDSEPNRPHNDGIHPNDLGYLELAHTVASELLGRDVAHRIRVRLRESNPVINTLMQLKSSFTESS
jgi:lysophospholipase L1-like esterase